MTMHTRTYWYDSPRGFANEYDVGIALSSEWAQHYADCGYERISRDRALRDLVNRGDNATKIYASVSVNTKDGNDDRFEIARLIRGGGEILAPAI